MKWGVFFSSVIHILNPAAVIMAVLKRTKDESLMMIMTVNSDSAGRLRCFLFYLPFDAL